MSTTLYLYLEEPTFGNVRRGHGDDVSDIGTVPRYRPEVPSVLNLLHTVKRRVGTLGYVPLTLDLSSTVWGTSLNR